MIWFLTIVGILLAIGIVAAVIILLHSQKILREQKSYERGLKNVSLRIYPPPPSDDIETGARDSRDVLNETISKAEVLYDIIASTAKPKGIKNRIYGQRHFSFEIVGSKGFVYFYLSVPVALLEVVQQAIISAYPSARLEQVPEKNIFSPVGKMTGTTGGELTLKEHFSYPIATYLELKRDGVGAFLNALSTLEKDDGAGIQILLRPANQYWQKSAHDKAASKRKGKDKKKSVADLTFWWIKQVFSAPFKPPEDKSGSGGEQKKSDEGPTAIDQALAESIEDKAKHTGYEVLIRVVASSASSQRAQTLTHRIVAAFSLFDAQGKNGFKFTPAKDIDSFITAYIMRFFPPEHDKNILNSVELATIFHFPDQSNLPTTQLERQASKQVDGPRNISETGLVIGYNIFRGAKKRIMLDPEDRRRHVYIVGQTGVGKSIMLENLALQDMLNGDGFAFIDPHGDTAEKLLSMVPKERTEDVVYFSPADMDYPMGLNLFEFYSPEQKDFLIQESLNMLYKLYDPQKQGIIGPRFERIFTNCALLLMSDPKGGTFVDVPKVLIDADFMKEKLKYVTDQNVLDFWTKEWPNSQRSNEAGEVTSWVVSKFGAFLSNEMMRNIIGQTKSSFNMREIMDNKKILLVNLSKGKTGELNSKLLGMIFVMKFQAAAMSRADVDESERTDFSLYVDEFQNFSTDSFASILSEARKYRLNLIVANQFTTQLSEEIRGAIFGNVGTILSFRVGNEDAEFLARYFAPVFDVNDLQRLPNWNAIVRLMIGGVPSQGFSLAGLPPLGSPNKKLGEALKQLSAAKHGRPRATVEKEIFERLRTNQDNKGSSPAGAPRPSGAGASSAPPARPKPATGSSFLDDWLSKKQSPAAVPKRPPQATAQPPQPTQPPQIQQQSQQPQAPVHQQASLPPKPEQPVGDTPTVNSSPSLQSSEPKATPTTTTTGVPAADISANTQNTAPQAPLQTENSHSSTPPPSPQSIAEKTLQGEDGEQTKTPQTQTHPPEQPMYTDTVSRQADQKPPASSADESPTFRVPRDSSANTSPPQPTKTLPESAKTEEANASHDELVHKVSKNPTQQDHPHHKNEGVLHLRKK